VVNLFKMCIFYGFTSGNHRDYELYTKVVWIHVTGYDKSFDSD